MKPFLISILLGAMLLPPAHGWRQYRAALVEASVAERGLTQARAQLDQLVSATSENRSALRPIAQSDLLSTVNASVLNAGLGPDQLAEFMSAVESGRSGSDRARMVQRVQMRLTGLSPAELGSMLAELQAAIPTMRASAIELTRSGRRAAENAFEIRMTLEHAVLQARSEGDQSR
ncbi:MAG: hypothetical protein AAGF47_06950 [Planctomycetota bacterium]